MKAITSALQLSMGGITRRHFQPPKTVTIGRQPHLELVHHHVQHGSCGNFRRQQQYHGFHVAHHVGSYQRLNQASNHSLSYLRFLVSFSSLEHIKFSPKHMPSDRLAVVTKISYSSCASEFPESTISTTDFSSTNTCIDGNEVSAASTSSLPSLLVFADAEKSTSWVRRSQSSNRRRRRRRKISSSSSSSSSKSHLIVSTVSTAPVTAHSKITFMKVLQRRRRPRHRRKQDTPKKGRGEKLKRRRMDQHEKWYFYFRKYQKFVQQEEQRYQQRYQLRQEQFINNKKISLRCILPKDRTLRRWMSNMRHEYQMLLQGRKSRLNETRVELLQSCGFSFLVTPLSVSWETRYDQLLQFLKKHNGKYPHELISTLNNDEMDLYQWCNRQRILRKAHIEKELRTKVHITDERIERLDAINFVWSINHSQWQERYDELKDYYNLYGNCMVPARWVGNVQLARWVETQRRQYTLLKQNKSSQLTPERMKLLEALEFEWDPYEVRWLERYKELIEFQRLNGDLVIPTRKTGKALFRWLVQQQKAYHQWVAGETSTMNEQRRDRLEALGFNWTIPMPKKKKSPLSKVKQQLNNMK